MNEYDYEKRVMGSTANLSIVAADRMSANAVAEKLFAIAEEEEARFSRFRTSSELSRLNMLRSIVVSKEFMEALQLGITLHQVSSGVFNPLVDISRFGYDADISAVKNTERSENNVFQSYNTDISAIHIDSSSMTVSLQEGQHLDFGGYIKGHTAEKMASAAEDCQGVLVNLGGDIYAHGLDTEGKPFIFSVDTPGNPEREISFFTTNTGIATSGSYNRQWTLRGTPFFHILDQTGMKNPSHELISTTVIAPTGAEADAFATVAFVLGVEEGRQILNAHGFEYCFIKKDGSLEYSGGFPLVHKLELPLYAY